MKAMLLAAGLGTRLRPLTDRVPKSMIPIGGKPLLEYNINWLKKYDITDILINLHYLPHVITDYFGDGSKCGVRITYSLEKEILGTAGGVKNVAGFFNDPFDTAQGKPFDKAQGRPFIVWYGDNLSTCNLGRLLQFHKEKGGVLTIALFHREDVTRSGILGLAEDDRVLRYLEKPGQEEIFSHWVNAGIMVLEPEVPGCIPSDRPSDFGRDVIPAMLAEGERIFGYRMSPDEDLWWIDTLEDMQRTEQEIRRRNKL
jgi:NDP-sugar pyrophosphorylase family protein